MQKQIITFIIILCSFVGYSQDYTALWKDHFSYFEIKDVVQGNGQIYAASENAVFKYDVETNTIETITTVNGLSGETITTITYSETYNLLMIGYENGLIEIVFDDGEMLSVVDILEKETVSPANKNINHFYEHDGLVYISTDYGISVYDLFGLEFGDTYLIGAGGSQIVVNQTTIYGGQIYAACSSSTGLKTAAVSNANLIDYQQWDTVQGGNFIAAQTVGDQLYVIKSNRVLSRVENNVLTALNTFSSSLLTVKTSFEKLVITTVNDVYVYDSDFNLEGDISVPNNSEYDTNFTSATIEGDNVYIGSETLGLLKTVLTDDTDFSVIRPEGPLKNSAFKINAANNGVWVSYGAYTYSYNSYPLNSFGISRLNEDTWNNIPFNSLLGARNLNEIIINPFNAFQVYISSFKDGILELNNEVPVELYDNTNSGLESLILDGDPSFVGIRVSGSQFDNSGLLWSITSKVDSPLKSYDPANDQWQSYSYNEVIENGGTDEQGFSDLVIDNNGTKWVGCFINGVIGFNENGNQIKKMDDLALHNMPSETVRALAVDQNNQLWIGTIKGLRVLYNTSNYFETVTPSVSEIVILEDGIPQELLSNQFITDIKVDGSNNKWVGTLTSGVFYFSPDGQQTIYHFTTDNSPLPSDAISDISIDDSEGRVYIATEKGLVSFLAGGSKAEDELKDVYVYPNPVRPEYNLLGDNDLNNITKGVKIKGLTENVNVKITDIEGNLVAEAQSSINLRSSSSNYNFAIDGGTAVWNGKNLGNNIVASGVYLILISDLDTFETKVLKLLIIR
ncbi:type IX secretion system anionic LPS delivery protein PorZ [Lacinutrix undariae]